MNYLEYKANKNELIALTEALATNIISFSEGSTYTSRDIINEYFDYLHQETYVYATKISRNDIFNQNIFRLTVSFYLVYSGDQEYKKLTIMSENYYVRSQWFNMNMPLKINTQLKFVPSLL